MKVLIFHLGGIVENIIATSILTRIKKKYPEIEITWVVKSNQEKYIFQYNKFVKQVYQEQELEKLKEEFYITLFLSHCPNNNLYNNIKTSYLLGCNDKLLEILEKEGKLKHISLFQMYYLFAGITWKGEGYDIGYYPKTRCNKNRIGLSMANANLRNYVYDNMSFEAMKFWHIPYKKNIFKRMDEINRCKRIITDDMLTFHLAMALRKYVYFLRTVEPDTKMELFGNGEIHIVPKYAFQ